MSYWLTSRALTFCVEWDWYDCVVGVRYDPQHFYARIHLGPLAFKVWWADADKPAADGRTIGFERKP